MEPDIASIARLIADNARAKMLSALMCGKALTATELSLEAEISPQTASSHLNKLVDGALLVVRKQGRHKYFQLRDAQVADLIEQLLNISASVGQSSINTGPIDERMRRSRVCYDHFAGEVGVALFDALAQQGIILGDREELLLTEKGREFFAHCGVSFDEFKKGKRPLCRACLDWSERRSHLAGSLGSWILSDTLKRDWAHQALDSRAILFTPSGWRSFQKKYQIQSV